MIKRLVKGVFPRKAVSGLSGLRNGLFDGYARKSYSQEGEDMILWRIFDGRDAGFYVDVGAFHPKRLSNTHFFYKKGWRGINLDATPGSMAVFNRQRPRDINIEAAISSVPKEMTFFIYNEPNLNTFDRELVLDRQNRGGDFNRAYHIIEERKVRTATLAGILKEKLPNAQKIDFLSVDVEGMDLDVLGSNDWQRFRPEYILVEVLWKDFQELPDDAVYKYLVGKGYRLMAKTVNTLIFRDGYAHKIS